MRASLILLLSVLAVEAANLVPNSSFECGPGRGWMYYSGSDRGGNADSISDRLSNTAWHGAKSFEITSRLISRAMYLTAGTYTLSFYCRAPSSLTVRFGLLGASELAATPAASATATNGWQRFTGLFTISTNFFYHVKIYHVSSSVFPLVDGVQVESGAVATTYTPSCPVEVGLDSADPYNQVLAGEPAQFRLRFWNDAGGVTATGDYRVYDWLNRLVGSGSISQSLAANTNATVAVNLPATNGWLRVTARLYECNDSWDETSIAVLPYAAQTNQDTNAFLGTHPNWLKGPINRERRSGFGFARDLSPAAAVRWTTIEPTQGNFVWNDEVVANLSTNQMAPIFNLATGLDGAWPTWATNGDGSASFTLYTNYVYQTVARYAAAPYNAHYWETINEPQNFTSNPNLTVATNLARLLDMSVAAIRAADPAAYIIGLGGENNAAIGWSVWTNLTATTQSNIDALSFHAYPNDNSDDPNATDTDTHYASPREWATTFAGIKPLWNTESGTWSVGGYKTLNALLQGNYDLSSSPSPEASRIERQARHQAATDRLLVVGLRSLGWGIRYIHYWSKYFNDQMVDLGPTDPTGLEYNGAEKPPAIALLMATKFAGLGFGRFTNVNAGAATELYVFTNGLGSSIAAWNNDRTLKTLTTTNGAFALYDCMGNQLQTNSTALLITRTPRYIVSGSLTSEQLSNTVQTATAATPSDTTAPAVSFDIAPSGVWDGSSSLTLAKWSGHDENKLLWTTTGPHTNLVYKWHLDGDAYSAYSASNHVWLPALSNGNHTLYVTALDALGNSAEYTYQFSASAVPEIEVRGNSVSIIDGDTSPDPADHTDWGSVVVGNVLDHTFTVANTGGATLTLSGSPIVSVSGADASMFTVTVQPSATITAGNSTTFTVRFTPSSPGAKSAALSFANDDADENPFNFSIAGTGASVPAGTRVQISGQVTTTGRVDFGP